MIFHTTGAITFKGCSAGRFRKELKKVKEGKKGLEVQN
jgi:hypothetical protein